MILRSLGYYDMWAKWGEKSVKKLTVRDTKSGEMIDHDEYVRRFRERPEIKLQNEEAAQRIANGGYTDAEMKRKKYDQGMSEYNRFVVEQEKAKELVKRRFELQAEIGRLDKTIEEEKKRATEEKLAMAKQAQS